MVIFTQFLLNHTDQDDESNLKKLHYWNISKPSLLSPDLLFSRLTDV